MTDLLANYIPPSRPSGRERVDYGARLADITRMTDTGPSVGGFLHNAYTDTAEMIHGIGALPHLVKEVVTDPATTLPAMGRGLWDWYAEAFKHPLKYGYEHPVSALTDLLTLWSAGAGAVGKVGDVAKIGALSKIGEFKPAALAGMVADAAKSRYLPLAEAAAKAGTQPELSLGGKIMRDITTGLQGREAGIASRAASSEMFGNRFDEALRMRKLIGGSLSADEGAALAEYAQNPRALIDNPQLAQKFAPETKLGKAFDYIRGRGKELSDWEVTHGIYSPEEAANRPWMPAAYKRLTEQGLTPEEIGRVQETLAKNQKSWINDGLRKLMNEKGITPEEIAATEQKVYELPKGVMANEGIPRDVWMAWKPQDRLAVSNAIIDSLKMEVGEHPANLVYYPHVFTEETNPGLLRQFFLARWPLKKQVAPFAKYYSGAEGYSTDINRVMDARNAAHFKMQADAKLIDQIKEKALPWNGSPSGLLPGYVAFTPDSYMTFRKMIMEVGDDFTLRMKTSGKGVKGLLDAAFPNEELAQILADKAQELVRHGKVMLNENIPHGIGLYQVPKSVARALKPSFTADISPTLKLFWDSPMNFWRSAVLAMSPRWLLYNTIGNVVLNTLAGVSPKAYLDVIKYGDVVPSEVKRGFLQMESAVQHVGAARTESLAGELVAGSRESTVAKVAGYIPDKMRNLNSKIESYFRGAHYMDQAVKEAKMNLVKQGISKWKITDDMMRAELGKMAADPATVGQLMKRVNEFLFDYTNMGPFERGVLRRFIMPFYSWYKNVFRLTAYTLPVKYPGRLAIIRNLGHLGWDQMGDMYRQAGIDPKSLPEFMQGAIPIGRDPKTGNALLLTTRGPNPLETILQLDLSTLSPPLKLVIERFMGMDLFKKKPFTSPDTIDFAGGRGRYNPETGQFETVTVKPSLPEHIARQFPQYTLLENLVRPYSRYSTGSIFNPQPMVDQQGRPLQEKNKVLEALKYFGLNVQSLGPEDEGQRSKTDKRNISALWRQLQNQQAFGG